jgi:hypothetical protein
MDVAVKDTFEMHLSLDDLIWNGKWVADTQRMHGPPS